MPPTFDISIKASATDVAQAVQTSVDAVMQRGERLRQVELQNDVAQQAIDDAVARRIHEGKMRDLEYEERQIVIEKRHIEVERESVALIKERMYAALEVADKMAAMLYPDATDAASKADRMRELLPNLWQIQQGQATTLTLPRPKSDTP